MMSDRVDLAGARLDPRTGRLFGPDGQEIELRHQSQRVLALLAARRGETVSRQTFQDELWEGRSISDDSLAHCIVEIRKALGDQEKRIVETVPRKGYRLAAPGKRSAVPMRPALMVMAACGALSLLVTAFWWGSGRHVAEPPVIAVLAFDDYSPPDQRGYLSDAISEGIIDSLARYPELTVLARKSSFRFRDEALGMDEIGRRLGASLVLEGSQQFDGETIRITTRLIDTQDQTPVWTDRIDTPLEGLLTANAQISRSIANSVGAAALSSAPPIADRDAVSALLLESKGRALMRGGLSRDTWEKSLAMQERALREFPDQPWGYLGKALALRNGLRFGWLDQPKQDVLVEAEALARRSVEIDPDNYMTHYALGRVLMARGMQESAIAAFETAAVLNPSSAMVLEGLAQPFLYMGDLERTFEIIADLKTINPLHGRVLHWLEAWALWYAGECDDALKSHQEIISQPVESLKLLAAIQSCRGDTVSGRQAMQRYLDAYPVWTLEREADFYDGQWTDEEGLARWLSAMADTGLPTQQAE